MNTLIIVAAILISLAIGIPIGMVIRKKIAESKIESAEQEAKRLVDLAKIEAENLKKEEIIKAKEEMYKLTIELDGTLSGEHGIGSEKKKYIPMAIDKVALEYMKKIKAVFDPKNILNPDKIF